MKGAYAMDNNIVLKGSVNTTAGSSSVHTNEEPCPVVQSLYSTKLRRDGTKILYWFFLLKNGAQTSVSLYNILLIDVLSYDVQTRENPLLFHGKATMYIV